MARARIIFRAKPRKNGNSRRSGFTTSFIHPAPSASEFGAKHAAKPTGPPHRHTAHTKRHTLKCHNATTTKPSRPRKSPPRSPACRVSPLALCHTLAAAPPKKHHTSPGEPLTLSSRASSRGARATRFVRSVGVAFSPRRCMDPWMGRTKACAPSSRRLALGPRPDALVATPRLFV